MTDIQVIQSTLIEVESVNPERLPDELRARLVAIQKECTELIELIEIL